MIRFINYLFLLIPHIYAQAGCESESKPGPNGWPRFNNNKFKYLAEIVEHKLVLDGNFDTYRFTIKFQANDTPSGGSEYALTFDPQTELYRGIKRAVIQPMELNNENQLWKIFDGKIQPLNSDFSLGIMMDDTVGVFDPAYLNSFIEYPRELSWHYDTKSLYSLLNSKVLGFATTTLNNEVNKSIKVQHKEDVLINAHFLLQNKRSEQLEKSTYLEYIVYDYQTISSKRIKYPAQVSDSIWFYGEKERSTWLGNDDQTCTSEVITESSSEFGLDMKKIVPDQPAYPYPILPKQYFRFDASLNTSYERTEPFDEYITCFQSDYHDLLENNFQKMSPHGWLTPSDSEFVSISPQMQFKDRFGRSTIIESWKTFIDYDEDDIPAFQDDIPSGTDCQRHFTLSSINLHKPDAFSIQLETINPKYKFISSANILVGQNAFKMETFPTDFEVFANKDHFPFGKEEYITIFDSNLEIVYITTKQMNCQVQHMTEYQANQFHFDPHRILSVKGEYNGKKLVRNLQSKIAFTAAYRAVGNDYVDKIIEDWAISTKILYDDYTEWETELPIEYNYRWSNESVDIQYKTNMFDQRNFKDELPLDSFSPLICFDHKELIAVEFNLTGPATIDTRSQYSVLKRLRFEIAGKTNIKSEYRVTSLVLDKIESIYVARFVFLPVIDGPDGSPLDLPTSQALSYLNQTINDNDFEFSLDIDDIRTSFMGVPSSLLTSDDGISFNLSNSNVIVKNQTVYEEQNSKTTTIATACISTLLTLVIVAGIMIFYHRRNPYEAFTNSTELRTM